MTNFKIASFNLYNLVSANQIYYGNKQYSTQDYQKKIAWVKSQIQKTEANIIGFQEIFHKEALIEALEGSQFQAQHLHLLGETGNSPVVGLASTYPLIGEPEQFVDIPSPVLNSLDGIGQEFKTFSRPVLKVKLALNENLAVSVFVCHLKSKRPSLKEDEDKNDFTIKAIGETRSLLRRAVEASGLRSILLKEMENNDGPVIVIGDLNDSLRAVTSNIIAGPTPWKFDSIENKLKFWDRALYSTFDIISQKSFKKEWATHIYNGHYDALDHIFVSQEFYHRNKKRIGDVSFVHILDDHLKDDTLSKDRLPKWKSDHGQVVASFRLKNNQE